MEEASHGGEGAAARAAGDARTRVLVAGAFGLCLAGGRAGS